MIILCMLFVVVPQKPRALVDASLFFAGLNRQLTYRDDLFSSLTGYRVPFAPTLGARVQVFPGRWWVGLQGRFEYTFTNATPTSAGRSVTNAYTGQAQLLLRIPVRHADLFIAAGADVRVFNVANVSSASARYWSAVAGIGARVQILSRLALRAELAYLYVLNAPALFPRALTQAIDASVAVEVWLVWKLDVRLAVDYRRYFMSMRSQPGDS